MGWLNRLVDGWLRKDRSNLAMSAILDPGDGMDKRDIFEVWGDVVEDAAGQADAAMTWIVEDLQRASVFEAFEGQVVSAREDGRRFLALRWGDFRAHIDARPFGEHLDIYGILAIARSGPKKLVDDPNPLVRLADLEAWQRRDLQVFQSFLRHAIEDACEALDEGRV